jgi:hypothetical protein
MRVGLGEMLLRLGCIIEVQRELQAVLDEKGPRNEARELLESVQANSSDGALILFHGDLLWGAVTANRLFQRPMNSVVLPLAVSKNRRSGRPYRWHDRNTSAAL